MVLHPAFPPDKAEAAVDPVEPHGHGGHHLARRHQWLSIDTGADDRATFGRLAQGDGIGCGIDPKVVGRHLLRRIVGSGKLAGCHQTGDGRHIAARLICRRIIPHLRQRVGLNRHPDIALIGLEPHLDEPAFIFDKGHMHGAAEHILGDRINAFRLGAVFAVADKANGRRQRGRRQHDRRQDGRRAKARRQYHGHPDPVRNPEHAGKLI